MKILDKLSGDVIFEFECKTIKECVLKAKKNGADLSCADLWGASLRGANLWGANLRGANLWGEKITKTPVYINAGLDWQVWITDKKIKIGCQIHSTSFWEKADDNIISQMSNEALDFWKKWKKPILIMAKEHQKI
jgi:hypothetical protein